MRRARAAILVVAALVACADEGSGITAPGDATVDRASSVGVTDSVVADGSTSSPSTVVSPEGFDRVRATATAGDGTVCDLCLWLADDDDARRTGLMHVTDLGPADGMAFVYPRPRTGTFWMKNTLLPLSIAFFDRDGRFMDAFDMTPCTSDPCPTYRTPVDFLVAVEVVRGGLAGLGLVDGSLLELTDLPCD